MISCKRTRHSIPRQVFMAFYMLYYAIVFTFSYVSLGAMFTSITLFFTQTFGKLLEVQGYASSLTDVFNQIFTYSYLFLVTLSLIMSLTTSVDRAVGIF
jgi:hypothetical protein